MVISMYETLLNSIKNYFNQSKRTSAELSEKMHQLFQDNIADYDRLASWYDESKPTISVIAKAEYEHYIVENYKRSVYGDNYEIKKFKWQ